jgi:serine/threonine-protein kinase RsbT
MSAPACQKVEILIKNGLDVIRARRHGLEMALALGFAQPEATKIAVVISELGRNIENYAGMGSITLTAQAESPAYFEIVAADTGPGITDINKAMSPGYSTAKGLGVGLPGSKRLMDEFFIRSTVGLGTTVKARKWLR